jgi:hypothetical protein
MGFARIALRANDDFSSRIAAGNYLLFQFWSGYYCIYLQLYPVYLFNQIYQKPAGLPVFKSLSRDYYRQKINPSSL